MFGFMVFGAWLATQPIALAADDFGPVEIGQPAPTFSLPNLEGETVTLEQHRGKVVVLEWFNPGCPFVVYAHEKGPLMAMAKAWTDKDVVWLAINSGAPGKQGAGLEANTKATEEHSGCRTPFNRSQFWSCLLPSFAYPRCRSSR